VTRWQHLKQEDQVLGCRHGALHQHDQGAERVQRQPSQPCQPCTGSHSLSSATTVHGIDGRKEAVS